MLRVLANRTYRHLFAAQVIALIGTGLATVALGLLAYDLAGANAGAVLGTALAIKMVAYVGVSPIAAASPNVFLDGACWSRSTSSGPPWRWLCPSSTRSGRSTF